MTPEEKRETYIRANRALQAAYSIAEDMPDRMVRNHLESIRFYHAYAETGYEDPECGLIASGDWNDADEYDRETDKRITTSDLPSRLANVFRKLGIELEWCDEWTGCHSCCRALRTRPDDHSWKPCYIEDDGAALCLECVDVEEYLESLEGDSTKRSLFDPSEHEYVLIQGGFEAGVHPGQDADPELIGKLLSTADIKRFVFCVSETGQFDLTYSVWMHKEEAEEEDEDGGNGLIVARRVLERGVVNGPSRSEAMKRGLQEASRQSSEMRASEPPSIVVSSVTADGTTTKVVSMEDFVAGKALD